MMGGMGALHAAGLTTRIADAGDVSGVVALVCLAYCVEAFFLEGDRTNADDVRARMARGQFLLLEDSQGKLAGCVYVEVREERGYFGMLAIDPARQRQGLGAELVAAAEAHCRAAGCAEMEIDVVNLRTELPPFYRRLGYMERGSRPFPDEERARIPCHLVVMAKAL